MPRNTWRRGKEGRYGRQGHVVIARLFAAQIAAQRGQLFLWAPVAMALGIGAYFRLPFEPSETSLLLVAAVGLVLALACRWVGETFSVLCMALVLAMAAFSWAGARAQWVGAPVLEYRFYGPIQGRVVAIDRSVSDKVRLTLDRAILGDKARQDTPDRVRLSLHGDQLPGRIAIGTTIMVTGYLSPPSGPVEPGGFDFQRQAWFKRIGAVGYTRVPVLVLDPPDPSAPWVRMQRFRQAISAGLLERIDGQAGAMAAAIVTGDRSALSRETLEDMRHSNLAHLLAISGLHVGLLTGVVFAGIRGAIALIPFVALRIPGKKWAAVGALLASASYLLISGGSVSTQRAFIQVAVMLVAVLADRRAITLRSVALAAVIVLVLHPESLLGPGFQMSFAATTALVWVFARLRDLDLPRLPTLLRGAGALVLSSAVAGFATAPFAAAHFNQIAAYGLAANLMAVPVMGSIVAPAAVLAGPLSLIGAEAPALWVMGQGIDWILGVAGFISNLDGALRFVPSPHWSVLPLLAVGAIWIILWNGRAVVLGLAVCAAAMTIWSQSRRPDLLIADTAGLVGVLTPDGRALSKLRGDGFAAVSWLENDGHLRDRQSAYDRADLYLDGKVMTFALKDAPVTWRWSPARGASCDGTDILISTAKDLRGPCLVLGPWDLADTGAISVTSQGAEWQVQSARLTSGDRLWSGSTERARDVTARLSHVLNEAARAQ